MMHSAVQVAEADLHLLLPLLPSRELPSLFWHDEFLRSASGHRFRRVLGVINGSAGGAWQPLQVEGKPIFFRLRIVEEQQAKCVSDAVKTKTKFWLSPRRQNDGFIPAEGWVGTILSTAEASVAAPWYASVAVSRLLSSLIQHCRIYQTWKTGSTPNSCRERRQKRKRQKKTEAKAGDILLNLRDASVGGGGNVGHAYLRKQCWSERECISWQWVKLLIQISCLTVERKMDLKRVLIWEEVSGYF